jgi:hypothetical protein
MEDVLTTPPPLDAADAEPPFDPDPPLEPVPLPDPDPPSDP